MLRKRELSECQALYDLLIHPEVFPYVRHKASSYEEYMFITKQMIQAEEDGELISRTILDEWENPIGTINLFDIEDHAGFLATWIGNPYFGKGYNKLAKELFFDELFHSLNIEKVFMKIRKANDRSNKAAIKLPYIQLANEENQNLYSQINQNDDIYNLYKVDKDNFTLYCLRQKQENIEEETVMKEA